VTSHDLAKFGIAEWWGLGENEFFEPKELVSLIPRLPGVYVVRTTRPIGRLLAESDVLYVGCAKERNTLRQRIASYLRDYAYVDSESTTSRISSMILEVRIAGQLEIGWTITDTGVAARALELDLLRSYYDDHLELPPLNRRI